jgi:hypothetical protein
MRTFRLTPCAIVAIYTYALLFGLLNEHFDRASPTLLEGIVVHNGMRYNPLPNDVIDFQTSDGKHSVSVLETTAYKLREGDQIRVVQKPGLFGKAWYEEAAFYAELKSSRTFQGAVALVLLFIIAGVWGRAALKTERRVVGLATFAIGLLSGFGLFYAIP